jgi:hypothetical protein
MDKIMKWGHFCCEKIIREGGGADYYHGYFDELLTGADYSRRRKLMAILDKAGGK